MQLDGQGAIKKETLRLGIVDRGTRGLAKVIKNVFEGVRFTRIKETHEKSIIEKLTMRSRWVDPM